jgi:hypothetical protein
LVKTLQIVLSSPNIPLELLQMLLNLAEFMEHDSRPLPLEGRMLARLAMRCKAYAKALHYKVRCSVLCVCPQRNGENTACCLCKLQADIRDFVQELEFHQRVSGDTIEDLITINNLLQQQEAAIGMLIYAQQNHRVTVKESWYRIECRSVCVWVSRVRSNEVFQVREAEQMGGRVGSLREAREVPPQRRGGLPRPHAVRFFFVFPL